MYRGQTKGGMGGAMAFPGGRVGAAGLIGDREGAVGIRWKGPCGESGRAHWRGASSRYSGWIAIFIFSSSTFFAMGGWMLGPEIIAHSIGMTLLLCNVTVPPSTGNFNIPCAVDDTARIFFMPGLSIIALCWDGDLMTMKFIQAEVECASCRSLSTGS
ncbi:hypothetical protein Tco_1498449 [Tanacetum coccineum]